MDNIWEDLSHWGCDTEGTMERLLGDKELFILCIRQMAEDPSFEELGRCLANGKTAEAFDSAHTLKGALANIGVVPLYSVIVKIVEPLRKGDSTGLCDIYKELLQKRQELRDILKRYWQ